MLVGMDEPEDEDPAQVFRVSGACSGRGIGHLGARPHRLEASIEQLPGLVAGVVGV